MLPVPAPETSCLGRREISKLEPERATKLNAAQAYRKTMQKLSAGRGSSLRQGTEQERAVQQSRAVLFYTHPFLLHLFAGAAIQTGWPSMLARSLL